MTKADFFPPKQKYLPLLEISQNVSYSSPPTSLLRSASFHGTEGMGVAGRWPRRPNHLYNSEDDGPYSLEQEVMHPI